MKIIFFIESLRSGGKERRLVELLSYLRGKPKYELMVVLMEKDIHYTKFLKLMIPFIVIERRGIKKDPRPFYLFYQICKKFKPDIIHTWGYMNSLYALPTVILQKKIFINSHITKAPPNMSKWSMEFLQSFFTFYFSSIILANSIAGLQSYNAPPKKSRVIYNGMDFNRFKNIGIKDNVKGKFGLTTQYTVVMVASFSDYKDYDLFLDIAKSTFSKNKDISFIAVGDGKHMNRTKKRVENEKIQNVIFTGRITNVESVVSIADIGMLFSNTQNHGEGISNSILEYMALGKPVIANNAGGTKEIVHDGVNGYLIKHESPEQISNLIIGLIKDRPKRLKMGSMGKKKVRESFTIERMGKEFEQVYFDSLSKKKDKNK